MAILGISRDTLRQTVDMVRIDATTSTLAQASTTGYILAQDANIVALNNGPFQWLSTDFVLLAASDGWLLANISSDFESLIPAVFTTAVTGLPVVVGHIAVFSSTGGNIGEDAATAINGGNLQAGLSGTAGTVSSFPAAATSGHLALAAVTNSSGDFTVTISNAAATGQSQVISIPDSGASTANFIISKSAGTQHVTVGALQVDAGAITSGLTSGGFVGLVKAFPTTGSKGFIALQGAVNASGNFGTTISNATAQGQAQVISIPDSGAATANFVLDTGTNATVTVTTATVTTLNNTTANITNLKYGATPVAQVDPASCTITAAAGASNHCTITIQLKDGSGTNMTRVTPFKVYLATTNSGLVLQSAASTGYSVTSGGVVDPTGSTTITQGLAAFSSATGGCVIDLLDTGKGTGNLILMLPSGFKASAAVTSGSYGA